MVKKLKCWRKLSVGSYRNKGRSEDIKVKKMRKGYGVELSSSDDIENTSDPRFLNKRALKNKSGANKFAKKYMRKNNSC